MKPSGYVAQESGSKMPNVLKRKFNFRVGTIRESKGAVGRISKI